MYTLVIKKLLLYICKTDKWSWIKYLFMSKISYKIEMPKSKEQLESLLNTIFTSNPNQHIVVRVIKSYVGLEDLLFLLEKYNKKINNFKQNKSIVLLTDDFEIDQIPEFIPMAPTEEEALDIIDFEEIERNLLLDD